MKKLILYIIFLFLSSYFGFLYGESQNPIIESKPVNQINVVKNLCGKDGSGLCVNSCVETLAKLQGIDGLDGFTEWSKKFDGGSYPGKFERQISEFNKNINFYSRENVEFSEITNLIQSGYKCVITVFGYLPQYDQQICTTVVLVKISGKLAWIIDTNFPEYGVFTISLKDLEKGYNKSPWVIFLIKKV